jgi:exonuclease VII small subunit
MECILSILETHDWDISERLIVCVIHITVLFNLYKLAAIQALNRKKRYEKQLQKIDRTLSKIEMQREALEGANTNTAVLQTMKNAADALKGAHQHMYVILIDHSLLQE